MYKSVFFVILGSLVIHNNHCYGMDNQSESLEVTNERLVKENKELKQRNKELKNIASRAGERLMKENEELRESSLKVTPQLYYGVSLASVSLLVLGYLGGVLLNNGAQKNK